MKYNTVTLLLMLSLVLPAYASPSPPKDLWKGILAEAVSEGYTGMYAVTCVYKNRLEVDLSLGCVGIKRKNLDEWIYKNTLPKHRNMAKEIVIKIFEKGGEDITKGATHYENIEAFGTPKWTKNMVVITKIGVHTFYKRK